MTAKFNCDLCGTGTYVGRDPGENRYCPNCESLRDIEKIKDANPRYWPEDEV